MELKDTIDLMTSNDYKERFQGEYLQLKIRRDKLRKMLIKHEAGTLNFEPTCDTLILNDQLYHMEEYLKQLEIRAEIEGIDLQRF